MLAIGFGKKFNMDTISKIAKSGNTKKHFLNLLTKE